MSGNERDGDKSKDTKTSFWGQLCCVLGTAAVACTALAVKTLYESSSAADNVQIIEGDGAASNTLPPTKKRAIVGDGDDEVQIIEGDGAAGNAQRPKKNKSGGDGAAGTSMNGIAYELNGKEIKVDSIRPGYVITQDHNITTMIPKSLIREGVVYTKGVSLHAIPESQEDNSWIDTTGFVIRKDDPYKRHLNIKAFLEGGVVLDDKRETRLQKDQISDGIVYRVTAQSHLIPDLPSP